MKKTRTIQRKLQARVKLKAKIMGTLRVEEARLVEDGGKLVVALAGVNRRKWRIPDVHAFVV